MSNLVNNVDAAGKVLDESPIEVYTVPLLLYIEIIVCEVKIVHPVIIGSTSLQLLENLSLVVALCY
jgi:hypothetical protein